MDLIKLLEERAIKSPDKPAIIFKEKTITFLELRNFVFNFAFYLKGMGVGRGVKVAFYLPACLEYIFSYLAIWYLGATAVPLDFMLTEEELISCIAHSEASLLILKKKATVLPERIKGKCPALKETIASFDGIFDKSPAEFSLRAIKPYDYAIIFYTSGTTGKPKGVLISYPQLGAPPMSMDYFVDLKDNDIALCALPFSHIGGLIYIQNMVAFGLTVVLMERFLPLEFLRNVQNYRVSCFWIVPSMYYAFLQLKEFENFDLSSLRWIVTFGASSSPDALRRFHRYCPNARLLNGWGMTETNAPTTVLPLDSLKIESVGRPAPWIKIKIVGQNNEQVRVGEAGEVLVQSWVVTDGYYKAADLTSQALRDGWFHTGDLGKFDAQGHLYIVGRIKEMLKVGGEIVFEPEVEDAIQRHPDVAESAVIGVADELRGEVPKAFIILKEGKSLSEEDLRYFLRQHLAHFKIPHYFEFVASLPKNRMGKIDKEQLRCQLIS